LSNGDDILLSEPVETTPARRAAMAAERVPHEAPQPSSQPSESGFAIFSEDQGQVFALVLAEVTHDVEERLKATVAALREEATVELACVRDELLSRVDQKLFGKGLVDFDPNEIERNAREVRRSVDQRFGAIGERLDGQGARLGVVEEREAALRRIEVRLVHVAKNARAAVDFKARLDRLDARLDELVKDYRALHGVLADAEIVAPEPPAIKTASEATSVALLPRFITGQ
jgi:hypothetical protein